MHYKIRLAIYWYFFSFFSVLSAPSLVHATDIDNYANYFEPPGELINVGHHRLHIHCQGSGSPTVLIDSGLGGFSLEWKTIQEGLANEGRICSYDRAGYGWSDPGPFPRTTATIVEELHTLLRKSNIAPPYVLVGHSFGGYNTVYFTKTYPDEVAGVVLVDASHPEQSSYLPSVYPNLPRSRGRQKYIATAKLPDNYPFEVRTLGYHLMGSRKAVRAQRFEGMNFEISGRQVSRLGSFPDIPLVVLTRGERAWPRNKVGDNNELTWTRLQNELARMSKQSTHITAQYSGHYIHLDQPLLVMQAIRMARGSNTCDQDPLYTQVAHEVVYFQEKQEC